jgi:hypothetical protein
MRANSNPRNEALTLYGKSLTQPADASFWPIAFTPPQPVPANVNTGFPSFSHFINGDGVIDLEITPGGAYLFDVADHIPEFRSEISVSNQFLSWEAPMCESEASIADNLVAVEPQMAWSHAKEFNNMFV